MFLSNKLFFYDSNCISLFKVLNVVNTYYRNCKNRLVMVMINWFKIDTVLTIFPMIK